MEKEIFAFMGKYITPTEEEKRAIAELSSAIFIYLKQGRACYNGFRNINWQAI